jgi:hypothetical protein
MKYIIHLIFILSTCLLQAQDITSSTLRWNLSSVFIIDTGETIEKKSSIVSFSDHIEWRKEDGTLDYALTILEPNGHWTNVNTNGSIVFEVDKQGNRGTISFEKDTGGTRIRIMLLNGDKSEAFELSVANIELL